MICGHGDDLYQYKNIEMNFSSNVYNNLDLSELKAFLNQNIDAIHSYPEPDARTLAQKISLQEQVEINNIAVTNGATESIYLIAQAFRKSKTAVLSPVFSEYADACQIHSHNVKHIFHLDALTEDIELFWLCNPNNPIGKVYEAEKLLHLIKKYSNTIFIMDHSYAQFVLNPIIDINAAIQYPNVIILKSMTKCFAIPGLRLGYMCAHKKLIGKIKPYCIPWAVNQMAQQAGIFLLEHQKSLQIPLETLLKQTQSLQNSISQIPDMNVFPTQTHYFLVRLMQNKTAAQLKKHLADEHHILIRDASNFVGLDAQYFRLACQNKQSNILLIKALYDWSIKYDETVNHP